MNKMIKVSPGLARIINSFGKSRTSLPSANGTKSVITNPTLVRIIMAFGKASKQVKPSPLSLRSADNANYSEVQDLKDRIAKLTAEKEYLKGQNEQVKTFYDNLQTRYDNLQAQHNDLSVQHGNLTNLFDDQQEHIDRLRANVQNTENLVQGLADAIRNFGIGRGNNRALNYLGRVYQFLAQI